MKQQARGALGQWVKARCGTEGWSLREAAAKTGLSHATIGDIIKGVQPSAETVRKLAHAFGGDGNRRLALEDELLVLAGYRTPRPEGDVSESMARLIDRLSEFSEPQIKMIGRFADFLSQMEAK